MPLVLEPEVSAVDLAGRLAALRREARRVATATGLLRLAAAGFATVAVLALFDRWAWLPAPLRAVAWLGVVVGGADLVRRWLVVPWRAAGDDLRLARRVEQAVPGLSDTLASVISFGADGSPELKEAARHYAVRRTRQIDFTELVDIAPLGRAAGWCVAAFGLLLIVRPSPIGWARLVDPYGGHDWPTRTRLRIEAPSTIPRGAPFPLTVQIDGEQPDRVTLTVQLDGAAAAEMNFAVDGPALRLQLEPARVPRSFRWRASGGDAATDWQSVAVIVPPELAPLDGRPSPQGRVVPPAYTQTLPQPLPDGAGGIEAAFGSAVTLRGATDRAVVDVRLEPRPVEPRIVAGLAALAAAGLDREALLLAGPVRLSLVDDGSRFEGSFTPALGGPHDLTLTDAAGLTARRPFDIRLLPDPPPVVILEQPASGGDGVELLPEATVNLRGLIEDSRFGARSVGLEYRSRPDERARRMTLHDGPALTAAIRHLLHPAAEARIALPAKKLVIERGVRIADMKRADGRSPTAGDSVFLTLVADDWDDTMPGKPPGRSAEVEIRVVTRQRLEARLAQARAEIAKSVDELRGLQATARDFASAAENQRRAAGELTPTDRDKLARAESLQQQIRDRLGDARDGLRGDVQRYRQALKDNPGLAAADRARAERLGDELGRLADEDLEPIPGLLAAARSETGTLAPDERTAGPLPEAVRRQTDAANKLRELSDQLQAGQEVAALTAEAGAIAAAQDVLQKERADAAKAVPPGVDPSALANSDRERLRRLKEEQGQLAERAAEFDRRLDARARAAQAEAAAARQKARELEDAADAEKSPIRSGELRREQYRATDRAEELQAEAQALAEAKAAVRSGTSPLGEEMAKAAEAAGANRLGEAEQRQAAAARLLDDVRTALRDADRPVDGERLVKQRQRAERQAQELTRDQELLQDRTLAAEQQPDALTKENQLKALARDQAELAARAEEQARQLRRDGQEEAARAMDRAARNMDEARADMEQGRPAASRQDNALEKLDEATDQVARDRRQAEERLQREQVVKVAERIKGLKSRQSALIAEAERVFQSADAARGWSRSLRRSLSDLGTAHAELGKELEAVGEKQLAAYKVIRRFADDAAGALAEVATAIEEMQADGLAFDRLADDRAAVRVPQDLADRRLTRLLAALDEAKKQEESAAGANPGGASEQPGGDAPAPAGDPIPPLAQLQLLRDLQAELLERTTRFAARNPDLNKLAPARQRELDRLRREQAELATLFGELAEKAEAARP